MTEERQDRYCACGRVMIGDGAICALCVWTVLYTDKTWTKASSMARVADLESENAVLRAQLALRPHSGRLVCTLCGSEAEYIEDEAIWRHKGEPFDDKYAAQSFCDRYGYPIKIRKEKS